MFYVVADDAQWMSGKFRARLARVLAEASSSMALPTRAITYARNVVSERASSSRKLPRLGTTSCTNCGSVKPEHEEKNRHKTWPCAPPTRDERPKSK
jgi:hypothetical protein